MRDPYEVLGVSPSASDEEIKKAYHRLARSCHPDLHPGDKAAAARMNEINRAYGQISEYRKTGRRTWEERRYGAQHAYSYQNRYSTASAYSSGRREARGTGANSWQYAYGQGAGVSRPKPHRRALLIFIAIFTAFLIGLSVYASRASENSQPERPAYEQQIENGRTHTVAAQYGLTEENENSSISE